MTRSITTLRSWTCSRNNIWDLENTPFSQPTAVVCLQASAIVHHRKLTWIPKISQNDGLEHISPFKYFYFWYLCQISGVYIACIQWSVLILPVISSEFFIWATLHAKGRWPWTLWHLGWCCLSMLQRKKVGSDQCKEKMQVLIWSYGCWLCTWFQEKW